MGTFLKYRKMTESSFKIDCRSVIYRKETENIILHISNWKDIGTAGELPRFCSHLVRVIVSLGVGGR